MDRVRLFLPIIISGAYFILTLLAYSFLCVIGRRPPKQTSGERGNFFDFLIHYFVWMLSPIERALVALRMRPDHLTIAGVIMCFVAGLAAATSHLATSSITMRPESCVPQC